MTCPCCDYAEGTRARGCSRTSGCLAVDPRVAALVDAARAVAVWLNNSVPCSCTNEDPCDNCESQNLLLKAVEAMDGGR